MKIALVLNPRRRLDRVRIGNAPLAFTQFTLGRDKLHALDGQAFDVSTTEGKKTFNDRVKRLSGEPFILEIVKGIWPQIVIDETADNVLDIKPATNFDEAVAIMARLASDTEKAEAIQQANERLAAAQLEAAQAAVAAEEARLAAEAKAAALAAQDGPSILEPLPPGPDDLTPVNVEPAPAFVAQEPPELLPEPAIIEPQASESTPSPEVPPVEEPAPAPEPVAEPAPEVSEVRTLPELPPIEAPAPAPAKRGRKPTAK